MIGQKVYGYARRSDFSIDNIITCQQYAKAYALVYAFRTCHARPCSTV
jgi:hypothetical protein